MKYGHNCKHLECYALVSCHVTMEQQLDKENTDILLIGAKNQKDNQHTNP